MAGVGACGPHRDQRNAYGALEGKSVRKEQLGRPRQKKWIGS